MDNAVAPGVALERLFFSVRVGDGTSEEISDFHSRRSSCGISLARLPLPTVAALKVQRLSLETLRTSGTKRLSQTLHFINKLMETINTLIREM